MIWVSAAVAIAAAEPAPVDAAQAAGNAMMACVRHSANMLPIDDAHADAIRAGGMAYQPEPPAKLRGMAAGPYGKASFARSPSTEGDVWAIGYDRDTCMVMVLGTPVEPIERRLTDLFAIPGAWSRESIGQPDPASHWTQYGWMANGRRLTAQMKVQPLPGTPVKGLVMVTVSPKVDN